MRIPTLLLCLSLVLITGCSSPLPSLQDRSTSAAISSEIAKTTTLGRALTSLTEKHPGKAGIYALSDPYDAFAARAVLAQAAELTLDVQYYIWRKDLTGTLLFQALHAAADRNVRVRLLLDDNNTSGLDNILAALDAHPNIEVRLFNPFVIRSPRWIGYITDFSRANRRMHNKSFTADNQATIIGGRNIGDEYFGATLGVQFEDMDVLAVGPVVNDVSQDFDRYWASASSYPVKLIITSTADYSLDTLSVEATTIEHDQAAASYTQTLHRSTLVRSIMNGSLTLEWSDTQLVSDDPRKGLGQVGPQGFLTHDLAQIIGIPKSSVELISPYFVPTATGVQAFSALASQGVQIKVLTNSLEATDVAAVHAGYAKRRKALLEAGITLYETRREAPASSKIKLIGKLGSSASSLHAKVFAVDSARVFVGSFNFDPRSARLNTELGFIISSPAMAHQIDTAFNDSIPASSYEVRLSATGKLYWLEQRDGKTVRYDTEPGTTFWQRAMINFMSILPIEWLL